MAIKPANSIDREGPMSGESLAPHLNHAFDYDESPPFAIRFWNESVGISPESAQQRWFEFWLRNDDGVRAVVTKPDDFAFGEAFIEGHLYVNGNMLEAAWVWPKILSRPHRADISRFITHSANSCDRFLYLGRKHSNARDNAGVAISKLSPHFYRKFRGDSMLYSCGLFEDEKTSLRAPKRGRWKLPVQNWGLSNALYLDTGGLLAAWHNFGDLHRQ